MNFKKTCKSVVSFVLGTGMMFSGFAFNSHPNAFFTEEFYAENLKKYKNDPIMTGILNLFVKLHENREKLCVKITEVQITDAQNKIVTAYKEFEKKVTEYIETQETIKKTREELNQVLKEHEQYKIMLEQLFTLSSQHRETTKQEPTKIKQTEASILQALNKIEQELAKVVAENGDTTEQLEKATQENEAGDVQQKLSQTIITTQTRDDNLKTRSHTYVCNINDLIYREILHKPEATKKFCHLISYLMVLSVSISDETNPLCLDTLAENIKKLFGENSTELDMHIKNTAQHLFGERTYEDVVESIIN